MMIDVLTFKNMHKDDTYAELINEKAALMSSMAEYENIQKKGGIGSNNELILPSPADCYQMELEYLSVILELMQEIFRPDICTVDTENDTELLDYYNEVLWNSNGHYVDNVKKRLAVKFLNKLAENGNPDAMNDKGALYFEGKHYKQSYKKAEYWYKKAADAGNTQSMSNLGYMYFYGQGVKQSYEKAYKYFSMAAMQDHPEGLNKIGDMYREGLYINKDLNMAMNCYVRANKIASRDKSSDAYPASLVRLAEMCLGCLGWTNTDKAKELLDEARMILLDQVATRPMYAGPVLERVNKDLEEIEKM